MQAVQLGKKPGHERLLVQGRSRRLDWEVAYPSQTRGFSQHPESAETLWRLYPIHPRWALATNLVLLLIMRLSESPHPAMRQMMDMLLDWLALLVLTPEILLSAVPEGVEWMPLERVVQVWALAEWVMWTVRFLEMEILAFPETDLLLEIVVTEA